MKITRKSYAITNFLWVKYVKRMLVGDPEYITSTPKALATYVAVLMWELKRLGIGWQRRTEKRWLANLLANEQAVTPLLKYLMTTELGSRGGEADREAKWKQRANQAGEELLDR